MRIMQNLPPNLTRAQREKIKQRHKRKCQRKIAYEDATPAWNEVERLYAIGKAMRFTLTVYDCDFCGKLHIGHRL